MFLIGLIHPSCLDNCLYPFFYVIYLTAKTILFYKVLRGSGAEPVNIPVADGSVSRIINCIRILDAKAIGVLVGSP